MPSPSATQAVELALHQAIYNYWATKASSGERAAVPTLISAIETAKTALATVTASEESFLVGVSARDFDLYVDPTIDGTVLLFKEALAGGGIEVSLASSDRNVLTVDATATVAQGDQSKTFTITGVAAGTATITASLAGSADVTVDVVVSDSTPA